MPTYDYECTVCHHVFEKFHSMSDEPEMVCPECGGPVKRKIGTGAGIIFKGGGFYITENRSKEYKDKAKSESSSSAEKAEKKPDTAPKTPGAEPPASPPPTKKPSGT